MQASPAVIAQRIARTQSALRDAGMRVYLVPSADPHLSEYLPERWQCRQWLSGFTGSMGTLVVTTERAALFADGRYWSQAETELAGSGIELVKIDTGASTHHVDWIVKQLTPGTVVGVDGAVLGLAAAQQLRVAVEKAGATLRTDLDIFETIWDNRASLPTAPVFEHALEWAVTSRADKLAQVRASMATAGATHHFISTVDDIAWLLNLRGSDVEYNPVFLSHLLMDATSATVFVAAGKVSVELAQRLQQEGVQVADYASAGSALGALSKVSVLLVDPKRVTWGFRERVPSDVKVLEAINPTVLFKSRKNAGQAQHIRDAMAQDGAAMCAFYAWLEAHLGKERITELTIDEKLSAERAKRPGFKGLSFNTIAGFNANGAMPHYRATPESHAVIEGNGLLLIDSGGQYLGGTTDITRVWPIGTPSAEQKRDYTLVLKGTLALSRARFPQGTLSPSLDALARAPLWETCRDYGHGTGHGVGFFLNVHEGPQSISKAVPDANMAMVPGLVTSIEPGLYRPGQWGVRIENLVLNVPVATDQPFGEFLEFETLTLCPIDTRCIEPALLRADEVQWLNAYHAMVFDRVSPLVSGDALAWLTERTRAL